jgi:DNA-binding transcriptional regulator YiaG
MKATATHGGCAGLTPKGTLLSWADWRHVDVARLRHRLGLSQAAFARTFGLDVTALHAWEQGRRRPDRAARVLLAVIAKEPLAVLRALSDE